MGAKSRADSKLWCLAMPEVRDEVHRDRSCFSSSRKRGAARGVIQDLSLPPIVIRDICPMADPPTSRHNANAVLTTLRRNFVNTKMLGLLILIVALMDQAAAEATKEQIWADYLVKDKALVTEWENRHNPDKTIHAELSYRAERDQLVRQLMLTALNTDDAKPSQAPFWWLRLKNQMDSIDEANQKWLVARLEEIEWFTLSEYGEKAEADAFLIVQHADNNPTLQKRVLRIYESLLPEDEIRPKHYAELRDRITSTEDGVQRYGTQFVCETGELSLKTPLEDPERVDQLRAEVGLPPIEESMTAAAAEVGDCVGLTGG